MSTARHHEQDAGAERDGAAGLSVVQALGDPAMYPGHPAVQVHETHASWVFVAGERAYKIKKPVRLAFLDYGTLARRRAACREEVAVNRELAPGIYLGVRAIIHGPGGFRFAPEDGPRCRGVRGRDAPLRGGALAAGGDPRRFSYPLAYTAGR